MYRTGGAVVGTGLVGGGAGAAAGSGAGPAELARTGAPLLLLTIIGISLLVAGFMLMRTRLQAAGDLS